MKVSLISVDKSNVVLGLRYISSYLKKHGHKTQLISLFFRRYRDPISSIKNLQYLRELVKDSGLICISSMTTNAHRAVDLINYLKPLGIPFLWGGVHATLNPEECLRHADMVCRGEGEVATLKLVEAMEKGGDYLRTKGIWFRRGGKIIRNELQPLVKNLDSLPFPDYGLEGHYILEKNRLVPMEKRHMRARLHITGVRGCANSCTYCCSPRMREIYPPTEFFVRKRSPRNIMAEIKSFKKKFGELDYVVFFDDNFFLQNERDIRKFSSLYKSQVGVPFKCYTTPWHLTEEKFAPLVDAGLYGIEMGIQTGSEELSRNLFRRYSSNQQILRATRIINKYSDRVAPIYEIITANPYEREEDIIATIRLLQKIPKPYFLGSYCLTFFPGTELYDRARKDGTLSEGSFKVMGSIEHKRKHYELTKKNKYLTFLLLLMEGQATPYRYGVIPAPLLKLLTNKNVIRANNVPPIKYLYNYAGAYWLFLNAGRMLKSRLGFR